MKKLIAISVVFVFVAGVAFAQLADGISVNAWGRGAFAPLIVVSDVNNDGTKTDDTGGVYAGSGATWGSPEARVDFRIHGATDYVGFTVASKAESGQIGTADDGVHLWAKPFGNDLLKLTVGRFVNDTLRGKVGSVNGGFECFSLPNNFEEDQIFARFAANSGNDSTQTYDDSTAGFMLSSAPVDGLFIGLLVNGAFDPQWGGYPFYTGSGIKEAKDAYRFIQIGAGYNIDGIGHIRAQWIGGYFGTEKKELNDDGTKNDKYVAFLDSGKPARIEAAFALTMVDGLLIDLGGKFWLPLKGNKDNGAEGKENSNGVDVSVGANFRKEAFNIAARVDAVGLGAHSRADKDNKSAGGMALDIRLTPAYDLDFATLGVDIGAKIGGKSKDGKGDAQDDSTMQIGFGGFIKKGLAGGYVKAGLTYTLAPYYDGKVAGQGTFMIPVVLEYAFF